MIAILIVILIDLVIVILIAILIVILIDLLIVIDHRVARHCIISFLSGQFVKLSFSFKMSGFYIFSCEIRPRYVLFNKRAGVFYQV